MGVSAIPIMVEVNVDNGIGFFLVGLPDSAVKESQQRIETALNVYNYKIPGRKIVVNMAPADIRKEGSAYDLTLAIGILAASEQIAGAAELEDYFILGELSLDGSLQPIRGALPIALEARKRKKKGIILPIQNAREAAIVDGIDVLGASDIKQVIDFFDKGVAIEPTRIDVTHAFNDSLEDAERLSARLGEAGADCCQLLPFHQFGENKYALLGKDYPYRDVPAFHREDLEDYRQIFLQNGINAFF